MSNLVNLTNIMIPEQLADLPNKIGIAFHVNRHGEAIALTASRDVSNRCRPAKMNYLYDKAVAGESSDVIEGAKWYTDELMQYPEAFKRIVFLPFHTFEDADKAAKLLRKSMEISSKQYYHRNRVDYLKSA